MGIVVIGAVFVDIKGYPLSTYIPGGRNAGRMEQVHGGVSRNVAEDIANVELRPTFVSLVDDSGMGQDVIDKLDNHKVNTRYIQKVPDGMGTWLAIFDNDAAKIGMTVGSLVVQDVEDLKRYLDENTVDIAVIAVPVSHAQRMVEALCERGVKGFWNFAPLDLKVPDGTSVVNVHLDEGLEILSFRMLRELA